MSRELFAVVSVYEKFPMGNVKILHNDIKLNPEVYNYVTEGGIKFASNWFHLKVTTYEGMVTDNERNN